MRQNFIERQERRNETLMRDTSLARSQDRYKPLLTDPGYAPAKLLSRDLRAEKVIDDNRWSQQSSSKNLSSIDSADNFLDTSENSSVI